MRSVLRIFFSEEHGSAVIDWTVLTIGAVMLGLSVAAAVTANVQSMTGDTAQTVPAVEDWQPS